MWIGGAFVSFLSVVFLLDGVAEHNTKPSAQFRWSWRFSVVCGRWSLARLQIIVKMHTCGSPMPLSTPHWILCFQFKRNVSNTIWSRWITAATCNTLPRPTNATFKTCAKHPIRCWCFTPVVPVCDIFIYISCECSKSQLLTAAAWVRSLTHDLVGSARPLRADGDGDATTTEFRSG